MSTNSGRPVLPSYEVASARAEVAYWTVGDGPPILVLHSFPDHAVGILPFAKAIASAGYRAVIPALPGYWPSGPVDNGDYSVGAVAVDLLALLDVLGIDRAHVVGHGWGGEIAYHLGSNHADRVDRLAVLGVPHPAGLTRRHRTFQGLQSAAYAYFLAFSPLAVEVASNPQWLTAVAAWASPGLHRDDWPTILELIARPSEIEIASRYYRCDLTSMGHVGVVSAPTALIHGASTPALPPYLYEGLEPWFSGGVTRHLIDDAGQWPHLEAPEEVLKVVLAHLESA